MRCVSSGGIVIGENNPTTGRDENDMSISLLVTYGHFKYFVGGDIEEPTESKIAARDLALDVDVYQANHHGSHTSSSQIFMDDLSPTVIIISNGNHGGFQHPRQAVLDLYATLPGPPKVFQTNKYTKGGKGGNVPDAFIGDPESVEQDGTILITVNIEVGSYVVSYGDNTSHTFQINGKRITQVVIESLLPNPHGNDRKLEEVTLKNTSDSVVSLAGWTLMDRNGGTWNLSVLDSLAPGESKTVMRDNQKMSLNNAGDEITLLDAGKFVIDRYEYTGSSKGVPISTGH